VGLRSVDAEVPLLRRQGFLSEFGVGLSPTDVVLDVRELLVEDHEVVALRDLVGQSLVLLEEGAEHEGGTVLA